VFHLQDVICSPLYVFGDLVSVSRTKEQGAQNQHIESPLKQHGETG
jgi:hypothetical protein